MQSAASAAEALENLMTAKPDVLIADIGMPHEDGYVLIQKLRAFERERAESRIPAMALTAYASVTDRDHALEAGYDLHLTKPVGLSDLMQAAAGLGRKS